MADAKNTGPSLRDMAFAAAGGGRKQNVNLLTENANKVFETYSKQMADAAAQRRAARQDKKSKEANTKEYGSDSDGDGVPNSLDPDYVNKSITTDSDSDGNPDYVDFTKDPPPVNVPLKPPGITMRSPIKQSLYGAAFAAAGGFRKDTKNISDAISGTAAAFIETRKNAKKFLADRVTKELEAFSPEVVDLQGFSSFLGGADAVTNFGLKLKEDIAKEKQKAVNLNPYSTAYKETMSNINSLIEKSKNLVLEQTKLKNLKKEWGTSSSEDLYSQGSSKTTVHYIDQVMTNTASIEINDDGQVVFNVAREDDETVMEKISFDKLNENLFLKVDASNSFTLIKEGIRDDVRNNAGFDRSGVEDYWADNIAPSDWKDGKQDGVLLSWIHDKPHGGMVSYKENFIKANSNLSPEQVEAIFDVDTTDWSNQIAVGTDANGQPIMKTIRELIYEDLVKYNANLIENYYSKQTKVADKYTKADNYGVSDQFDDLLNDEFSEYIVPNE
jgi:hypothetical protein